MMRFLRTAHKGRSRLFGVSKDAEAKAKGLLQNEETKRILTSNCFYKVMNLDKSCSEQEIRAAYMALTKKYHPDVCHFDNSKEIYTRINSSYNVLSDKDSRQKYNDTLERRSGGGVRTESRSEGGERYESRADMEKDLFENINMYTTKTENEYTYWDHRYNRASDYSDDINRKYYSSGQTRGPSDGPQFKPESASFGMPVFIGLGLLFGGICLMFGFGRTMDKITGVDSEIKRLENRQAPNPNRLAGGAVNQALAPDGVLSDNPTVMRKRFKQLSKEFEQKNITIEVVPNKLHPKYQRLLRDPDHIKYINKVFDARENGSRLKIFKSESILQKDSFRRRLTLEEHNKLFQGLSPDPNVEELELIFLKMRGEQPASKSKSKKDDGYDNHWDFEDEEFGDEFTSEADRKRRADFPDNPFDSTPRKEALKASQRLHPAGPNKSKLDQQNRFANSQQETFM